MFFGLSVEEGRYRSRDEASLVFFLAVDDCADAIAFLLRNGSEPEWVDIAICDLADLVAEAVGFRGAVVTAPTKPDETPRKPMSAEEASRDGPVSRHRVAGRHPLDRSLVLGQRRLEALIRYGVNVLELERIRIRSS